MTRRTIANKLRALGDFMKILLSRTPNLDAYERSQNQPILREPKYGLDFEPWSKTHSDVGAYGTNAVSAAAAVR
jgi:hypothetical protein